MTPKEKSEKPINITSSQTENKGLDWLVSHWKKLQSEGEKMNWEQIIQITELAKTSSQTDPSDAVTRLEIIDKQGRVYSQWNCTIELSYQDDGKTLKIFVNN